MTDFLEDQYLKIRNPIRSHSRFSPILSNEARNGFVRKSCVPEIQSVQIAIDC